MDTIITLKNGLKVANFSSFHPFEFEDGMILPGVPREECIENMLDREDEIISTDLFITIHPKFLLNNTIKERLDYWTHKWINKEVDIVLTPLPVIQAMKDDPVWHHVLSSPFRTIYVIDRISKVISTTKFCI